MLRVIPCLGVQRAATTRLPAALVLLGDPDRRAAPGLKLLRSLGLTGSEARLAKGLAAGRPLVESARSIGISHNTARAHLRSVFDKLQVRSQVELVRVLCEIERVGSGFP